jgi:hypothetical protein
MATQTKTKQAKQEPAPARKGRSSDARAREQARKLRHLVEHNGLTPESARRVLAGTLSLTAAGPYHNATQRHEQQRLVRDVRRERRLARLAAQQAAMLQQPTPPQPITPCPYFD